MVFNFAEMVESNFENQLLKSQGEYVNYYDYSGTETFDDDGYLISRTEPTAERVKMIIATFTQKDIQEFDLGNMTTDDHKAYAPNSITPNERDEIERDDGERYEVVKILHEHAIRGIKTFYTLLIRRRTNVS